jgi:hypothetical protein
MERRSRSEHHDTRTRITESPAKPPMIALATNPNIHMGKSVITGPLISAGRGTSHCAMRRGVRKIAERFGVNPGTGQRPQFAPTLPAVALARVGLRAHLWSGTGTERSF